MHTKVKAKCTVETYYRSDENGGDDREVSLHYEYDGKQYSAKVANMGIADMLCQGAVYTGRINPRKHGFIRITAWQALRELSGLSWLLAVGERIALYAFPLFLGAVLYWLITM